LNAGQYAFGQHGGRAAVGGGFLIGHGEAR
jgi:hypothetical protein